MAFRSTLVNAAVHKLEVSVVVTLMDDRGQFEECLSGWTQRQTFPRERYEVIVVGSGRESAGEAIARSLITAHDRLLTFDAPNETALYDLGARHACGKWLLFTEAHCAPEPRCLQELMAYLDAHDGRYHGACLRSAPDGSSDPLAAAEGRWYQDGFARWTDEDDWRKVTIRGTAVRRDVYAAVGGFKSAFGCFAESLLAAELHAGGYRLGYAAAAAVKHYNSTDVRDLVAYVNEYRAGEAAFRRSADAARFAFYFGWSDGGNTGRVLDRSSAFSCVARSLVRAITRLHRPGAAAMAYAMLETLAGLTADTVSRGRVRWLRAKLAYFRARVQFAMPAGTVEQRYQRFCRLWDRMSDAATARAQIQNDPSTREHDPATSASLDYRPGEMNSGALRGFYARETHQGESFRWSSPLALVRVSVPAGDYEVQLETKDISGNPPAFLECYLNGRRMHRMPGAPRAPNTFHAPRTIFRNSLAQELVLTSGRVPTVGAAEHRRLGVPVFSIRFVPQSGTRDATLSERAAAASFVRNDDALRNIRG